MSSQTWSGIQASSSLFFCENACHPSKCLSFWRRNDWRIYDLDKKLFALKRRKWHTPKINHLKGWGFSTLQRGDKEDGKSESHADGGYGNPCAPPVSPYAPPCQSNNHGQLSIIFGMPKTQPVQGTVPMRSSFLLNVLKPSSLNQVRDI